MTTAEKADKVFQSGLAFRIWNKPVKFDQLWDIRLFSLLKQRYNWPRYEQKNDHKGHK